MNRRNFIAMLMAAPLAFCAGFGRVYAAAKVKLALVTDPAPKALGYVTDATKAPASLRTDKTAMCHNCMYYVTKDETKEGGKKVAPCTLFQNSYVYENGWCRSWFKKA